MEKEGDRVTVKKEIVLKRVLLNTYDDDHEVQLVPAIRKIGFKAISHPLEKHLQNEDVSKDHVCIFQ